MRFKWSQGVSIVLGSTLLSSLAFSLPSTIVKASTALSVPENLQVTHVTNNTATLSWTASSAPNVEYQIVDDTNNVASSVVAHSSGTTVSLNHLHPNTTYWYVVQAIDGTGDTSPLSNLVVFTTGPKYGADNAGQPSRVVGYFTNWSIYSGYDVTNIPANQVDFINYAFATIDGNGKIASTDPWADYQDPYLSGNQLSDPIQGSFDQLWKMKQQNPNLKTIISVGGWGPVTSTFSTVASSDVSRQTFADSVVQFLQQYKFDGVDLDWEYPVSGGAVAGTPADKHNFTLLLQVLRQKLDTAGGQDGKHYYLTIAGNPTSSYIHNVELNQISQYVDWINLMTYDLHGGWDSYTGVDSPLFTDPKDPSQFSDDVGVQSYLQQGVPADKIVMGIPLYDDDYHGVQATNDGNNGIWETYTGGETQAGYNSVVTNDLNQNGFVRYWNNTAQEPYLFNGNEFITYEDPESIFYKTQYLNQHHLGGAMVWSFNQDYNGELLVTIFNNLNTNNH
jgi:chitinase